MVGTKLHKKIVALKFGRFFFEGSIHQLFLRPQTLNQMPIRSKFPKAGEEYQGVVCDGFVYRIAFKGSSLAHAYEMIRQFLNEEGYGDVPLPPDIETLEKFRLKTRNRQILLFEDNGYVHNPVKVLFPTDNRKKKVLILELYNEQAPDHLLRFHRKLEV